MRDITPNSGAYLSESDYYEPNWPRAFFGDNYERLKSIKEEYDPNGMFRVWNGVGGLRPEGDYAGSSESPESSTLPSWIPSEF